MQLGMIGLGRMGANMVRRLLRGGHQCIVYDVHPEAVKIGSLEPNRREAGEVYCYSATRAGFSLSATEATHDPCVAFGTE